MFDCPWVALAPVIALDQLDGKEDAGEVRLFWYLNLHEVSEGCLQQVGCVSSARLDPSGDQRVHHQQLCGLLGELQDIDSGAHGPLIRPFRIGI